MAILLLGKSPFRWLVQTFRTQGPIRTTKVLWHAAIDPLWDLIHGTETLVRIPPHQIETHSGNKAHATMYGATRARPLVKLFVRLGLSREAGFVDFGSGKGRVLMIAALYGFRKIVGVEFSEALCQLAARNLEAFNRCRKRKFPVTIVHSDVVHYAIQGDDTVFFIYDPFGPVVLRQVLDNLCQSVKVSPRHIFLIYNSPRHHDVVESCPLFSDSRQFEIGGSEFHVYSNAPFPKGAMQGLVSTASSREPGLA